MSGIPVVLNAPGATPPVNVDGRKTITCVYRVSDLNTSVTVRLEGSLDGVTFVNLDPAETDTEHTANGVYGFTVPDVALIACRFVFVGEVGGTSAVISAQIRGAA